MIEINETDLPAIGKKYTIEKTNNGDKVVILIHNSGKREIYYFENTKGSPIVISFNDEEARKIGAILEGVFFKPTPIDSLELVLSDLIIEWVNVTSTSKLANKSISELEIRKKTGVSIIAIIRKPNNIPNPMPDTVLLEGDTLVVIGKREQFSNFNKFIE